MSFVTTAEVADFLGVADHVKFSPHIDQAEAIIAGWLGTYTLVEHEVEEHIVLPRYRNSFELSDGPIHEYANVTEILLNGTELTLSDLWLSGYWMVRREDNFAKGDEIDVTYFAGFQEPDSVSDGNLPNSIKQAIIRLAAIRSRRPDSELASERIGDYAYTLKEGGQETLQALIPYEVQVLVQRWRRP